MHGFFDVFWGSLLGIAIAFGQYYLGPAYDDWLLSGTLQTVTATVTVGMSGVFDDPYNHFSDASSSIVHRCRRAYQKDCL